MTYRRYTCQNCKGNEMSKYIRSKGKIKYKVYVCQKCKCVVGREYVDSDKHITRLTVIQRCADNVYDSEYS